MKNKNILLSALLTLVFSYTTSMRQPEEVILKDGTHMEKATYIRYMPLIIDLWDKNPWAFRNLISISSEEMSSKKSQNLLTPYQLHDLRTRGLITYELSVPEEVKNIVKQLKSDDLTIGKPLPSPLYKSSAIPLNLGDL